MIIAEKKKIVRGKNHQQKFFRTKFSNKIHLLLAAASCSLEWLAERFYPIGFAAELEPADISARHMRASFIVAQRHAQIDFGNSIQSGGWTESGGGRVDRGWA